MVNLGIIGVGGIACSIHIPYVKECSGIRIAAICDVDEAKLERVGAENGIPEAYRFTDYRDLVACKEVDAVLVATPHNLHLPMALAVCKAKKNLLLEKPIALDAEEGALIAEAVKASGVKAMICFSYRFYPAVRYAKELIGQGFLGEVSDVYVQHFKESALWQGRKLEWRFIKAESGHGVLIDLGVHLIDLTQFLVGEFSSVCATKRIAVPLRQRIGSEEYGAVEVEDSCNFIAELESGAQAVYSVSRCALGNQNTVLFEICGKKGSIKIDTTKPNELTVHTGETGAGSKTVSVPEHCRSNQMQAFADLVEGKPQAYTPTIDEGQRTQKVVEAVARSAENRRWERVKN